jgi:hypothetical protein
MIQAEAIQTAARELIARHGADAVAIAAERTARHEQAGDWPAHAIALRVLTEVERLLAAERNDEGCAS